MSQGPGSLEAAHRCRLCRADAASELLDFGRQPISNRFLDDPAAEEAVFPLVLSRCEACGLVQLSQAPPAEELTPRFPWISYREPESHLDELAGIITGLPGLGRDAPVWGVSSKDDSLLERLTRLGFRRTYRLDPARDLEIRTPWAGVETIQGRLTAERALAMGAARGRPQVIVARHILEHAHDLRSFLEALEALLAPGGYLVLEVPDCRAGFALRDYTMVWEEHVAYFTPITFAQVFQRAGLAPVGFRTFPYRLENVLTGIGQAAPSVAKEETQPELDADLSVIEAYGRGLAESRILWGGLLAQRRRRGEKIALLGAGHAACAFVNYLELREHFSFVADDDPHKQGLFLPGSRLPIRGSEALLLEDISLCLLSVNPEVEEKVILRNRAFVERGGQFASIFAASDRRLTA